MRLILPDDNPLLRAGLKLGWWRRESVYFRLTEKGKAYFGEPRAILLREPVRRFVVEVTGITDAPSVLGPSAKIVQYTWAFDWTHVPLPVMLAMSSSVDVPFNEAAKQDGPEIIKFFNQLEKRDPHKAQALFKLYDDGWRVEKADLPDQ